MRSPRQISLLLAVFVAASCRTSLEAVEPKLDESPSSLAFGTVPVLNPKSLVATLTDVGGADLTVSSVTVQPADGPFALSGSPPKSVPGGGGAETLTVVFTAPAEESYQGTLIVVSDDPTTPTLRIPLTGTGSTQGKLLVTPNPVAFGGVGEGNTQLETLTLTSVGTAPLIVNSIALGPGTDPAFQFASSTKTPVTLPNQPPGDSAQILVRFSPSAQTPSSAQGSVVIDSTDPDQPSLTVPLSGERVLAPVAAIADPGTVAVGSQVILDGSGSYDPGGATPLTYQWAMTRKPAGSSAGLQNVQGPHPQLVADQPGDYDFSLGVTNALGLSSLQPAHASLVARPADDLYVEMIWDNDLVDMDLHFLAPGGTFGSSATDCNGNNQQPTGFSANCSTDHLVGPGPEWAEDKSPAPGSYYTVDCLLYSTHGATDPTTNVTVRIYEYGVVVAQLTQSLSQAGQLWQAATIAWPSGAVTPVGQVVQGP